MNSYQEQIDAKLKLAEDLIGAPLSEAERKEFQSYTVDSIVGVMMLRSLTNDELKAALKDKAKHEELRQRVGKGTNPSWVTGQVAEVLYMRGEISTETFDAINENDGLEIQI